LVVIFSSPPRALTKSWSVLTYISARRLWLLPQGLKPAFLKVLIGAAEAAPLQSKVKG
jgi:hypothetical protein